jgi:hypothetical protein
MNEVEYHLYLVYFQKVKEISNLATGDSTMMMNVTRLRVQFIGFLLDFYWTEMTAK